MKKLTRREFLQQLGLEEFAWRSSSFGTAVGGSEERSKALFALAGGNIFRDMVSSQYMRAMPATTPFKPKRIKGVR